jgi:hypothetical protein
VPGGAQQIDEALLRGDAPYIDHAGPIEVDAEPVENVGAGVGSVLVGVDPVVDHLHVGRIDGRVGRQDVAPHGRRHGDDRVGVFDRSSLRPAGQGVAAAELFGLPRPQGFETVSRHHMWDPVEQFCQMACQVGVPRVGVDEIRPGRRLCHAQINRQCLQCGVRVA